MARFASGKKSKAISDISGFEVKYTQLKTTWDNLRVESDEYSPKHPQLTPARNVVDATALFNPRPDNDPENVTIDFGFTQDIFASRVARSQQSVGFVAFGRVGHVGISLNEPVVGLAGTGAIGDFAVGFDVTGVSATGNVGTASAEDQVDVSPTGLAGTGAIGTASAGFAVDGVEATGNLGTSTFTFDRIFDQTGVSGTGATGDEVGQNNAIATGLAGTGAIGSVDNNSDIQITGVAGTGAIGTFGESGDGTLNLSIQGVGAAGTAGVGSEVAESNVVEANQTGFGEQYWGYGVFGGDNEVVGTGAIGEYTVDVFRGPNPQTGVSATGAVGVVVFDQDVTFSTGWGIEGWGEGTFSGTDTEMGVSGTGAVGVVLFNMTVEVTGVSGGGVIGTETAQVNPGWSQGAWSEGTWGE